MFENRIPGCVSKVSPLVNILIGIKYHEFLTITLNQKIHTIHFSLEHCTYKVNTTTYCKPITYVGTIFRSQSRQTSKYLNVLQHQQANEPTQKVTMRQLMKASLYFLSQGTKQANQKSSIRISPQSQDMTITFCSCLCRYQFNC